MKAILSINHLRLLVPCAKKAIAFVEFLEKAQVVGFPLEYRPNEVTVDDEPLQLSIETLKASDKIIVKGRRKKA
jgi:hypothetical protein